MDTAKARFYLEPCDTAQSEPQCAAALSIVIPVYNSATTISALVDALVEANRQYDLQIVLVNDASLDGSDKACLKLCQKHPQTVTFVDLAKNVGEHNAVMAGLSKATGAYCVIMDDDFQNPPEEAYRLAEVAIADNRDIVFSAYKTKKHDLWRNLGSRFANETARRLMGLPPNLYLSSFKCLSRFTVDQILNYNGPFPYIDGLALRVTRNIGVVETRHDESKKERSGYTVGKLISLWGTITVNFSITPLRLGSILGFIFSLLGIIGAISVFYERANNPSLPVGWPSLIIAVLILSGVQLVILGLMGEYIGQLFLTINGTPQYVIRRVVEHKHPRRAE